MKNGKTNVDVVRAWKDLAYRATLSSEELADIPASPVGLSELDPDVLGEVAGGRMVFTEEYNRSCLTHCGGMNGVSRRKHRRSVGRLVR